jgi:tetratricopeptide (TPR) repeat protein
MVSTIKSWWVSRVISKPSTWQVITRFLLRLFLVLAILVLFKYLFFVSCLNVGSVKDCVTYNVDSSNTLFAIGGILVAIVALIPTFWIEGKIRDAKKEVAQEIFEEVKENMQHLSKAQMMIFDADRYLSPATLLIRDSIIQEAVNLWPTFKIDEYRKLSMAFSSAVIQDFYQTASSGVIQGVSIPKGQMLVYINKAIFYLEETVKSSKNPERDSLVNLACMYGCVGRYEIMIRTIEKAIKEDENARDDFQEFKRLSLLIYACGINRQKIEKLGKKIGKELPLSKDEFIRIVKKVDLQSLNGYINFFGIKKRRSGTEEWNYMIQISAAIDKQGQRLVCGLYLTFESKDSKHIPPVANQLVSIEEFFDEVDKELFVICFIEN